MIQPALASIAAVLPLPPSVNHQYIRRRDRVVLTAASRAYYDDVAFELRCHAAPPPRAHFSVTIRMYFPDRRRRDLDNTLKLMLDAIAHALGFDDGNIDELHVYRALDRQRPRAEVLLQWSAYD